ncbi:MAG: hypothetical protein KY429_09480 [Actinobacteria bacterium]|nr:hypothetical protein [Actinomycetota bacterium]
MATASVKLSAAQVAGTTHEAYSASASYDADPSKRSAGTDSPPAINVTASPLADLSVGATGLSAATPDPLTAVSSLVKATISADLVAGLVKLTDVKIDLSDESKVAGAKASQTASIDKIELVPLSAILDLTQLSLDDLLALADIADPSGAMSRTARDASDDLEDEINTLLSDPLACTAVQTLLPSASCTVDSSMSVEDLVALADVVSSVEQTLPTCSGADICPVSDALAALNAALDALRDLLGALSLLSIEGLSAGVTASAFDTTSEASATVADLGTVKILGQEVLKSGTITEQLATVSAAVGVITAQLNSLIAALGLAVSISPFSTSTSTTPDGSYQSAKSTVTALSVQVSTSGTVGAVLPLSMGVSVLSLNANAKHMPAVQAASPNEPLANTGESPIFAMAGFALIALALRLRRWLGDAA